MGVEAKPSDPVQPFQNLSHALVLLRAEFVLVLKFENPVALLLWGHDAFSRKINSPVSGGHRRFHQILHRKQRHFGLLVSDRLVNAV